MIYIKPSDLWVMLLCSTRYAMGRSSYIVGDVCTLLRSFWQEITPEQRAKICSEIRDELKMVERLGRTLGDPIDHKTWAKFVEERGR